MESKRKLINSFLKSEKQPKEIESELFSFSGGDEDLYSQLAYEKLGELKCGQDPKNIISDLKENKQGFDSSFYDKFKNMELSVRDRNLVYELEVIDGEIPCNRFVKGKKCGSKKIHFMQLQTRGGDEGITTFARCVKCGGRWKF